MSHDYDEAYRLRDDDQALAEEISQAALAPAPGARKVLARTISQGAYPTQAGRFHAMEVEAILGDETEGASPSYGSLGYTIHACNLGSAVPDIGTRHVCTLVPHRWVFRHG